MSKVVPEGWEQKNIGELVTLKYGKSPKEILSKTGNYPVIGTGGITGYSSSFLHEGGTTVIGRKGSINNPSHIEGPFWAIDTTYYSDNYKGVDPKWFYYSLKAIDLMRYNEASGVPSLNRDTLCAIPLLKPPFAEQQKIATILSSVDNVIEKTRTQIDKLKDLKTGMMQELLTKGIGHTEFKDSPVGRIPKAWGFITLGKTGNWQGGGTPSKANKEFWNGNIPWVSPKDMKSEFIDKTKDYITKHAITASSTNSIPAGSILIVARSGILKHTLPVAIAAVDVTINQDMKALVVNDKILTLYVFHYLQANNHEVLRATLKAGSTVESLDFSEFSQYQIPLPSVGEQQKIINIMESIANRLRSKQQLFKSYEQTKRALMQDLLTGKKRIN